MQKISSSTSTATPGGEFTEGSPAGGVPATLITAEWLNSVQRELLAVLAAAGVPLDESNNAQLVVALSKLNTWAKISEKPTTRNGYGLKDVYDKTETAELFANALGGKLDKKIPVVANLNDAPVGMFAAATATAQNSPVGGQGTIWGFTYLDPTVSSSKTQIAFVVGDQAMYVRSFYGNGWSPWAEQVSTASQRVAKAWGNFRGLGGIALRKGLNISSITDGGTGDYGVSFATPMPDANYAVVASGASDDNTTTGVNCVKPYGRTTNGFRIGTTTSTSGRTAFLFVDFSVFT